MTTTPLELPLPRDPVQRIHRFARDLAWGVVNDQWPVRLSLFRGQINDNAARDYIEHVWGDIPYPAVALLQTFGYVTFEESLYSCQLTEKAFMLLDETPPLSIFISYSRAISSALAMLIWSDLRTEGFQPFIDIRNIAPGDEWFSVLEQRVKNSSIFVFVVGPGTLESEYVRQELAWAEATDGTRIIPVLHAGLTPDMLPDELQRKNLIVVREERALDFYNALEGLRAALGLLG